MRAFAAQDVHAALTLMREALGEGRVPRSEAFFRWKHLENPFGTSIGFVVDDDAGGLLALRLFQRWAVRRGERAVEAVRAVDTATAPSAQGQGHFKRLTLRAVDAAVAEGVGLVFNTPNQKSGAGYLKMGWRDLGQPGVWVRPSRPSLRGRVEGEVVDVDVLAAAIQPPPDERLRTRYTAESLRWRYVDIPGFSYRMHRVGDAVAVFRRQHRRGVAECTICELHHPATVRGVLQGARVVDDLARGFAGFVSVMPTSTSTSVALAATGALKLPIGPRLFVRDLHEQMTTRPALGIGDLEIF